MDQQTHGTLWVDDTGQPRLGALPGMHTCAEELLHTSVTRHSQHLPCAHPAVVSIHLKIISQVEF